MSETKTADPGVGIGHAQTAAATLTGACGRAANTGRMAQREDACRGILTQLARGDSGGRGGSERGRARFVRARAGRVPR